MKKTTAVKTSRRRFLEAGAAAALSGAVASGTGAPGVISAADSDKTLKIALIGCGGRGTGAAMNALSADPHVELAAMGDLFEDRIENSLEQLRKKTPDKVKVAPEHCFAGFDAYQKVVATDVDVVLLTTPPGFRPLHLAAAVAAGKHSFVEIVTAVDAPGVRSVIESAKVANEKKLAIVSGFCWRYHGALREAREQIREGAIGDVRAVYATYYRGSLDHKYHGERPAGMTEVEWQLRDWYGYLWLSGDVTILLSGGHSVDKMSWWLDDAMPVKAVATGSRVFESEGNTFDNGFVAYEYAGGVRGFLGCRSQPGCFNQNADFIIGSKGTCTIGRGRGPVIEGETSWRYEGPSCNMYQTEHDELLASIRAGKPINDGTRMAHTTLATLMGRMAAYTGQEIAWQQALDSQQSLMPEKLDWDTKLEQPPRATPGLTKFV